MIIFYVVCTYSILSISREMYVCKHITSGGHLKLPLKWLCFNHFISAFHAMCRKNRHVSTGITRLRWVWNYSVWWSVEVDLLKGPLVVEGCLGYIRDYPPLFCGDSNKTITRIPIKQPVYGRVRGCKSQGLFRGSSTPWIFNSFWPFDCWASSWRIFKVGL